MPITPQQAEALDTVLGDPALIERLKAMVARQTKPAQQTKAAKQAPTMYQRLQQTAPAKPAPAAKAKSAYDRLKEIAAQPAGQGTAARTKAAMSPYESAVVAYLDAHAQLESAQMALNVIMDSEQNADMYRAKLKAQLLLEGNTAEVARVNEKYDLGYDDYPVDLPAKTFGFSSKGY